MDVALSYRCFSASFPALAAISLPVSRPSAPHVQSKTLQSIKIPQGPGEATENHAHLSRLPRGWGYPQLMPTEERREEERLAPCPPTSPRSDAASSTGTQRIIDRRAALVWVVDSGTYTKTVGIATARYGDEQVFVVKYIKKHRHGHCSKERGNGREGPTRRQN